MVKQRMSTADVCGEAACLRQRCLGMRVANVYDINSKASPDCVATSMPHHNIRWHQIAAHSLFPPSPPFSHFLRGHVRPLHFKDAAAQEALLGHLNPMPLTFTARQNNPGVDELRRDAS